MAKTQAEIEKDLYERGNMKTWKTDDQGNKYMVNRQTDSVTTSGITIAKDGTITKTNL